MLPARLLVASATLGSWALSATAAPLSPEDAAGHIGETATVCGVVASAKYEANAKSQPTLLDLGKAYPNAVFTAVVYGENRAKFGTPETSLRGKRVCVTGKISDYHGKAEIVLTDPSQLTTIGRAPG
jgi:DNA/RNA endonuclease YhcR with UshA esterase domain